MKMYPFSSTLSFLYATFCRLSFVHLVHGDFNAWIRGTNTGLRLFVPLPFNGIYDYVVDL